ncbi:MAG: hypothetical protein HY521_02885 [Proteobacteria bacterium]|nr:hypothetical protein [Pseudomonadota bacterium]
MQREAGILKDRESLGRALAALQEIERERLPRVRLASAEPICNWEWIERLELDNILSCGRLHCLAALAREETRGAHNRLDHPARDDGRWRARLLLEREDAGTRIVREIPGGTP